MNSLISFLFVGTDEGVYTQDRIWQRWRRPKATLSLYITQHDLLKNSEEVPQLHPYFDQFLDDNIDVVILKDAIGAAGTRPVEELTRYCAAKAALKAWFEQEAPACNAGDISTQVDTFLRTHHMDENWMSNSSAFSASGSLSGEKCLESRAAKHLHEVLKAAEQRAAEVLRTSGRDSGLFKSILPQPSKKYKAP